jgi:hypothetical protein
MNGQWDLDKPANSATLVDVFMLCLGIWCSLLRVKFTTVGITLITGLTRMTA